MSVEPSGKFVLRMEPALHRHLRLAARTAGVSLNEYCISVLAGQEAGPAGSLGEVVARALRHLGADLVGVAIFGSYARGEEREGSDVDVLIVTSPGTPITRALYAPWDEHPLKVGAWPVEPHFVRMPGPDERISGLWAEVAVDGAVLFDPRLELARRLTHVRNAIISGLLLRRSAHGQTYWTAA